MSEAKDWRFRIHDMLANMEFIHKTLDDQSREHFLNDEILMKAVERAFEIIGEAARFVPAEIQKKHANIEWSRIIGMRHKISHDYLEIDPGVLWDVYKADFFGLEAQLLDLLEQEDQ